MDHPTFYEQLFQPIVERLGLLDGTGSVADVGFEAGGAVALCTIGEGRGALVTYISCELAVREDQRPADFGRYEVMMTCDDERWAYKILTNLARMSLESELGHGHTIDVGPLVGPKCAVQGLVAEEFARVTIEGQGYGFLYFHGVTRPELEFANEIGADELLERLREAGVYPRTSLHRRKSIEGAA
jgi:hypothetical protein